MSASPERSHQSSAEREREAVYSALTGEPERLLRSLIEIIQGAPLPLDQVRDKVQVAINDLTRANLVDLGHKSYRDDHDESVLFDRQAIAGKLKQVLANAGNAEEILRALKDIKSEADTKAELWRAEHMKKEA